MNNNTEPVITIALITAAIDALIAVLFSFIPGLTLEQKTTIMGAVSPVSLLIAAVIQRMHVVPLAKLHGEN